MRTHPLIRFLSTIPVLLAVLAGSNIDQAHAVEPAFENLFDGKSLQGWKGKKSLWSVQDGTIVGQTSADAPIPANTFLVWQGGELGDFEFRCKVRFEGVNSGVQYRSSFADEASLALTGYQADLHPKSNYMGMMYGEKTGRGIIATGGQRVVVSSGGKSIVTAQLKPLVDPVSSDWNELRIVAVGSRMVHQINGVTTIDLTDNHPDAKTSGLLGLQLHKGGPMKAEFRELQMRRLSGEHAKQVLGKVIASTELTQSTTKDKAKGSKPKTNAAKTKKAKPSKNTQSGWLLTSPVPDWIWATAKAIRKLGGPPWGTPKTRKETSEAPTIAAPPGFEVEKIYSVASDQGSWVSLATDDAGRLYACDQAKAGLYRLTLREDQPPLVEKVSVGPLEKLSGAQGMYWAFDSLWFHQNGGNLIRISDTDGDDKLDEMKTYAGGTGGGEHGNHAVIETADGKALYLDGGNAAPLGKTVASRVPTWSEGLLLPRMWDANGHARGRMAPGGWITQMNPNTGEQTLHSIGYRNQYDIALNRHGDLFTYDADMEWDLGLPWYRPTRICFAASGSDYGWRSGSGKWPTYFEDSLPPVVEIGPGSPTGLLSGHGSSFPTKYQDAMYALDWTYGTMYAIHMVPDGAGYRGEVEHFVYGTPLPLTDAVIGHDGAMYFTVGGRGSSSALYRIRYTGDLSRQAPSQSDPIAKAARKQRRSLEKFHGVVNAEALSAAWPVLSNTDRFLRHAARVAVESQPVDTWADRVASEPDPQTRITGSVALARVGEPAHQTQLIDGLVQLNVTSLTPSQTLGLCRAYSLAFTELAKPNDEQRDAVIAQLSPLLPSRNADVNTELIRILTYLGDENVVDKVLALIENRTAPELPPWSELATRNSRYGAALNRLLERHPPSRELLYAFMLRNVDTGWTIQQRRSYFVFLNEAAEAAGGSSYAGYLTRIRDEALASCTSEERIALNDVTGEDFNPQPDFPVVEPKGPGQKWTLDKVLATKGAKDFELGRSLYFSGKCAACHRLNGLGGAVGPDLTSVRNKFDIQYLAEAIVHPSRHISDQYGSSMVLTDDGRVLTGLVVEQDNGDLLVYPVDENAKSVVVAADSIEDVQESSISQMPEGLLDRMNAEEVRSLLTYIMAGGDPKDKIYGKR